MPTGHQLKCAVREREIGLVRDLYDRCTETPEVLLGKVDIGFPGLGCGDESRPDLDLGKYFGESLATAGLHVQDCVHVRHPHDECVEELPRWPLLGRSVVEPREVPSFRGLSISFGYQLLKGRN